MDVILRRLHARTLERDGAAQRRTLGFFGAWQALDDDPVLLCECGDDDDCPHRRAGAAVRRAGRRRW